MKIFLDSGNPEETSRFFKKNQNLIHGQTTNPSLVAKNPEVKNYIAQGKKLTQKEALDLYRQIVQELSRLFPTLSSISIEVIADQQTDDQTMLSQAEQMYTWIPNAHLKFPCNLAGIKAADKFLSQGGRVNLTLVFTQMQALAIAKIAQKNNIQDPNQILISPFIGRLDDQGLRGIDLIKNILKLKKQLKAKFQVLAASARDLNHLKFCSDLETDLVTIPAPVLEEYLETDFNTFQPTRDFQDLSPIKYQEPEVFKEIAWQDLNLEHPLITAGLEKFTQDWRSFTTE